MPPEGPMCAAASGAAESERASSEEPMTALQAYNLKMLSEQARELDAFDRALLRQLQPDGWCFPKQLPLPPFTEAQEAFMTRVAYVRVG